MVSRDLGKNDSGETPLDDASGLIPSYITTRKELHEAEFLNISGATQYYLSNQTHLNKFDISRQSMFDLHKRMFNKVWTWAGKKRKTVKNIGVKPHSIDEEIQKFIDDYNFWIKEKMQIIEIISRIHHRLVWIHPFEGGNGRWSRLCSNLIYYKNKKQFLKWPEDELQLNKKSSFRDRYLKALKQADGGNYKEITQIHNELVPQS